MFQKELNAIIAEVLGLRPIHAEHVFRRMRDRDLVSGRGCRGAGAPKANVPDTAAMLIALMSTEAPIAAPDAFNRARGLLADVAGRPIDLVGMVALAFRELVDRGELSGGVVDFTLSIGYPTPAAILQMTFDDGTVTETPFRHILAEEDDELDGDRWSVARLAGFRRIADAIASRKREPGPSFAETFAAAPHVTLPTGGTGYVFARARGGPPAAGRAPRARRRK